MCRREFKNSIVRRAGSQFKDFFYEIYDKLPALLKTNNIPVEFNFCHKQTNCGPACVFSVSPEIAEFYKFHVFRVESLCPHLLYPIVGQIMSGRKPLNGATHEDMHSKITSLLGENAFSFSMERQIKRGSSIHKFRILPQKSRELGLMFHSLSSTHPEAVHLLLQKSIIVPS